MSRSTVTRALMSVAAAIGLTVGLAAPSSARTDVDIYEVPMGRFYGNVGIPGGSTDPFEQNLLAFGGVTPESMCSGEPDQPARGIDRVDAEAGLIQQRQISSRAGVAVYDGGGVELIEWVFTVYCPALELGAAPEPLATGTGNIQEKATVDISGLPDAVHISSANTLRASVTTADGEVWVIRGTATVEIGLTLDPETGDVLADDVNPTHVSLHVLNR